MKLHNFCNTSLIFSVLFFFSSKNYAYLIPNESDEYLKGYVQGLFINNYSLPKNSVDVKNGNIIINKSFIDNGNKETIVEKTKQATINLKGIKKIILKTNKLKEKSKDNQIEIIDGFMPHDSLFHSLLADPKWPRFTLAYQYHTKNRVTRHAFAPNFGASFPVYRNTLAIDDNTLEWEFGIQGGLFAIMDIGEKPSSLINADYYISLPISFRKDAWSALVRIYHLSSHLGDEFMLTPQGKDTTRINLSYEGIEGILSYNFNKGFRVYGGLGYIVHKDPHYIKPLKFQLGSEYRYPNALFNGKLRPVMGLDLKVEELNKWYPGISYKIGMQLENSTFISSEIQIMLEFYSGKSIHGQFFNDKIRYMGLGIHAFL
ncbi:MAG: hypothetical protein JWM09_1377 [Francisellaceae bacterium]|nr:hypothetical protein [Francisellaceae bacterium]